MGQSKQHRPPNATVETVSTDAQVVSPSAGVASDDASSDTHQDKRGTVTVGGDLFNIVRGFCMGAADTVPGVSGGTVALVMGHYARLVTSISHFDSKLLGLIRQKSWREASDHINLRFLFALGIGILLGAAAMTKRMEYLLDQHLPETMAVFLGLLIASLWVVVRYVDRWTPSRIAACIGGCLFAAFIASLPLGQGSMSLPYLFFGASIAICAMILPGISGAYVLLVLGIYHPVVVLAKNMFHLDFTAESLVQTAVFGGGCVFGLLTFSRLLRRLLERSRGATMAALMGLMIGSMGKLWPLQRPTPETASLEPKLRVMEFVAPSQWDGVSVGWLAALAVIAGLTVLAIEWSAMRIAGDRDA